MYKLSFLLARYLRPFYRRLAIAMALGAAAVAIASLAGYFAPAALVFALVFGAVAAAAVTLAVLVVNVLIASRMQRGFDRFEAAYDAYRRANHIPDIFYEEADLAEAAERTGAAQG